MPKAKTTAAVHREWAMSHSCTGAPRWPLEKAANFRSTRAESGRDLADATTPQSNHQRSLQFDVGRLSLTEVRQLLVIALDENVTLSMLVPTPGPLKNRSPAELVAISV